MTAENTEERPEQQQNSYKGRVYGNVLDMYDNPTYNLKLYMISPICPAVEESATQAPESEAAARLDAPPEVSIEGGGYINSAYRAPPQNTVILAQTGVTGNQIDNLELETITSEKNGVAYKTQANFNITQVGRVDFFDQILVSKAKLGIPRPVQDFPIFLEIVFKGYSTNVDNPDEGTVEPEQIGESYVYRMKFTKINLIVTEKGSEYECSAVVIDIISSFTAVTDEYYKLPIPFTPVGKTIAGFAEELQEKLLEYRKTNQKDYDEFDEVEFDVSRLFDTSRPAHLTSDTLNLGAKNRFDSFNKTYFPNDEAIEGLTPEKIRELVKEFTVGSQEQEPRERTTTEFIEGAPPIALGGFVSAYSLPRRIVKETGTEEEESDEDQINFTKGIDWYHFFLSLLSMNDEFYSRITRKQDIEGDVTNDDKRKPHIWWLKIVSTLEYKKYDYKRNGYAKKIVYYPQLYLLEGDKIGADPEENANLTKEQIQNRFDNLPILKSYDYIYSGLNDQIKSCNIEHNFGLAIYYTVAKGYAGNYEVTQKSSLGSSYTAEEIHPADGEENFGDLFAPTNLPEQQVAENALKQAANKLVDSADRNFLIPFVTNSGLDVKKVIEDKTSRDRQALVNTLQDNTQARELFSENAALPEGVAELTTSDRPNYSNNTNEFLYSSDILEDTDLTELLTVAGIQEDVRKEFSNLNRESEESTNNSSNDKEETDNIQPENIQVYTDNNTTQSQDGTVKHTILGQIAANHLLKEESFLVKLDMTIKGDPWWLGEPKKYKLIGDLPENSTYRGVVYENNQNYILFSFQTPRLFDFDLSGDEDAGGNTGYWEPHDTSYFVGGVYTPIKVSHKFSGGVFEQEIFMNKASNIRLSLLDKIQNLQEEEQE